METKRLLMLGLAAIGVTGVAGVALSGMGNEVFSGNLVSIKAASKSVTLDKDTTVTDLGASVDNVDGFPWKDTEGGAWHGGYVGEQNSSSRINLEYYTPDYCSYAFNTGDCFVEATLDAGDPVWEEGDEEEEEEIEGGWVFDPARFWFFIGLNNIQSFTIDYEFGDPSVVEDDIIAYEFMNSTIVGGSAGLSGSFSPSKKGSFTLDSTSSATSTCRYLRFGFWANYDTTFKITCLTVDYSC